MGEFFELYEAGILDAMGEYTGYDGGYESGWKRKAKHKLKKQRGKYTPEEKRYGITNYIENQFAGRQYRPKTDEVLLAFATFANISGSMADIVDHASANWKIFSTWLVENYKKTIPGNINNQ